MSSPGKRFPGHAAILLVACLASPAFSQSAAQPALVPCNAAVGTVLPKDSASIVELRRSVEKSPLFTIQASAAGVASCRVHYESAVIELEYRFKNNGWLHVKRDARIEYTNQEARFGAPLAEDPVAILTAAEHAAFGPNGCGIDWQEPETKPAGDKPSETETSYHGAVCNCQARIRRDAAGRVTGLTLRSAC